MRAVEAPCRREDVRRHCLTASSHRRTPRTSLTMLSQVAGVAVLAGRRAARDQQHDRAQERRDPQYPSRQEGRPVRPALWAWRASVPRRGMIGTGLSADANAKRENLPDRLARQRILPDRCPPTHHLPRRLGAYHPILMKGTHIRRAGTSTAAPPGTAETLGDRDLSPYVWESLATDAHVGARQLWNRSKGQRAFA